MKITKLIKNPLHAGRIYLVDEVTQLEGKLAGTERKRLQEYSDCGFIKIEQVVEVIKNVTDVADKPVARQRIQEASSEPVEEAELPEETPEETKSPKKRAPKPKG